ncbi:hypothetical protein [Kaistella yonginensis]|uniref:hypothetical protein n=1 Tax=Kaistella yonginensis TaxID=658267 RepID=UPI0025B3043B|nr:hypothetical protein [Kaistella yonginensis]MDN3607262.1 hypothetical protein [Kaistella yonginensis]
MGKTYILGNSRHLEQLGETFVEIPKLPNDIQIHNWVIDLFRSNDIGKVVIEIEKDPLLSLKIGYHIRLSIENIRESVLVPILYLSTLSLTSILLQTEIYSQILATKGVVFSEFDLESNKIEVEHLNGLNENEYLTKFLKIIHIQPDETVGRHSLANIWGAYAMDKASNTNALSEDSEFTKKLYFKYVAAFNNIDKLKPSSPSVIEDNKRLLTPTLKILGNINKPRRILLIDDEASKGWETVLRKIFVAILPEDFVVINEKVSGYDGLSEASKRIIEMQKFDLYLIDLRLNGLDEDENLNTDYFSGMTVLKYIKNLNKGNQIVVFTASNKVWNLKALLDEGADGYYMKESPEYNFSNVISKQNYKDFKEIVDKCFERGYLREIYTEWESAQSKTNNTVRNFITESNTAMNIAWEQLENNNLDFGFLILFQSIESIANKIYFVDSWQDTFDGVVTIDKSDSEQPEWLMTFERDHRNGDFFSFGKSIQSKAIKPTALFKVSCLFKILLQKDEAVLKELGKLNKLRNDIAHEGAKGFANKRDLIQILKFLGEIRNV